MGEMPDRSEPSGLAGVQPATVTAIAPSLNVVVTPTSMSSTGSHPIFRQRRPIDEAADQRLIMGERAEGSVNHSPGDIALFARRLAEALDQRSFFAALQEDLPTLLPATRVDIITNDQRGGIRIIWTYGSDNDLLPS